MNQYFKIGKLAASTGLKGELVLQHNLGKKNTFKGLEAIFLEEKKDSFIPYFIQSAKIRSDNETVIKLEGIDIVETARKLTPKEVWLLEEDFKKFAAKSSPIALLGFNIINEGEDLGEILEVIEQPHFFGGKFTGRFYNINSFQFYHGFVIAPDFCRLNKVWNKAIFFFFQKNCLQAFESIFLSQVMLQNQFAF